jgi:hypothetical protein
MHIMAEMEDGYRYYSRISNRLSACNPCDRASSLPPVSSPGRPSPGTMRCCAPGRVAQHWACTCTPARDGRLPGSFHRCRATAHRGHNMPPPVAGRCWLRRWPLLPHRDGRGGRGRAAAGGQQYVTERRAFSFLPPRPLRIAKITDKANI